MKKPNATANANGNEKAEKGEKKATMLAKIYGQFCAFFMCENHLAAGGRDRQGEERGTGSEGSERRVSPAALGSRNVEFI